MSDTSAKQAEVVSEMPQPFCCCELSVLAEFVGEVGALGGGSGVSRGGGRGRFGRKNSFFLTLRGGGRCGGVAAAGLLHLGGILSSDLRSAFPVASVNGLGEGAEFRQGRGFTDSGDFVLNSVWQPPIELVSEGSRTPICLGGKAVELNHEFRDALVIAHPEVFEFVLRISDGIVRSEVASEFVRENSPVVQPLW